MLDDYLNSLNEDEKEKTAAQTRFGAASVTELAKLAGVKLAEDVCSNCGDTMEKVGSIFKCGCGMRKKAADECPGSKIRSKGKGRGKGYGKKKGPLGVPVGEKQAGTQLTKEAADKVLELIELCDGDLVKTAVVLEKHGMSKEAIWGALAGIGKGLATGAKAVGKGQFGRAAKAVAGGSKRTGRQLRSTYQQAAKGDLAKGVAGPLKPGQVRGGGMLGGLKAVAKANPALAAGAGAAGAAGVGGAGYMLGKESSVLEVGDAAGRLLAKTAEGEPSMGSAPIPLDEIRESIQEAQGREDIPGRAKRWQIGGGVGGGVLGGGAGYGAGRLIGPKAGLIGAGIGAAGGALGGQHLGKQHGAEEARADKAVAMLRALRAHQQGSMSGFGAGMQRGYSMGRQPGGPEQEKTAFSVTDEGHRFDAEEARLKARHAAKQIALSQRHGAMGSAEGMGSFLKAFRGFTPDTMDGPRHQEYVAREHEAGSNAWNPFGGMLTPSSRETGGTRWMYGKFKQPDEGEEAAPAAEKAASIVKRLSR